MRHTDADANAEAIGIASGAIQYRFSLTVAAEVDARGNSTHILKPSPNGICMRPGRWRNRAGIAFNARINVESGKDDPVAAAFEPTQANTVFCKSGVLGAQQYRRGCGVRNGRALHDQEAQWSLQTRGF